VRRHRLLWTWLVLTVAVVLVSRKPDTKVEALEIRPVRTVTAARGEAAETVVLTGHVQAEDEPALAFRIGGRMVERPVNVGD
jgi:multidrug efflux pump subunit AcrA (membrane-fusion protein)